MRAFVRAGLALGLLVAGSASLKGQSTISWAGPPLFVLDVQGTPLDEFPSSVKALLGVMTTVDRNGQRMLMASSPSEFLINLPQTLPAAFTVVVDLIPKRCCNPEDFMLEGMPSRNRGVASAELTWHPEHIAVIGGGGDMYQSDMPADITAATQGNLTRVVVEVNGTTIKMYTNGRRLYTLDKQFARGRVLRVWLGGESATNEMYLAGLSVLSGAVASGVIAANTGGPTPPPGQQFLPGQTGGPPAPPGQQPGTGQTGGPTSNLPPPGSTNYVPPLPPGTGSHPATGVTPGIIPKPPTGSNNGPGTPGYVPPPPTNNTGPGTPGYVPPPPTGSNTGPGTPGYVPPPPTTGPGTGNPTLVPTPPGTGTGTASSSQAMTGLTPTVMRMGPRVSQGMYGPVVQWTALTGANGYTVDRWLSRDPTCCNNTSGMVTGSPWQDQPLTAAGTYVYQVTAITTGSVPVVEQVQFNMVMPVGTSVPTAPMPVASSGGTGTTATTAPPPAPVPAPIAAATGTPVRTSSAPPPGSGAAAALKPTGPPPTGIAVTGTPSLAKLNWANGVSGMRGVTYKVDRWLQSDPTCCATQSATLTFPSWTDEGLQWPGTYVFQVTELYPNGTFGVATTTYVRPDPVNPSNFRAASVSAGFVALRWDAVPNASWYELSGPGLGQPTFNATTGAYNVHNLAPGTYTWRVGTFYSSPKAPAPVSSPPSAFSSVTVTVP